MPVWAIIILILLGLPLLAMLLLFVMPRPILSFAERRAQRSMDIERFNVEGHYSHFGFRPVKAELQNEPLKVKGELPTDLEGLYIRNGTNAQFDKTKSRHHVFNGAGMLHQIQFRNGEARYSNSYVRTDRFKAEREAGEELYIEFGDLVETGKAGLVSIIVEALKKRFGIIPKLTEYEEGSMTTALMHHHGKLYALQETTRPFVLSTRREDGWLRIDGSGQWEDFNQVLTAPYTAHPKTDPVTGDIYGFSTRVKNGDVHFDLLSDGKLVEHKLLYTASPAIAFVHDYYLTENFLIFPESSLRFDPKQITGKAKSPFYFDADHTMRFGLIPRPANGNEGAADTDEIVWFDTGVPGHIWHTVNGWEEKRADGGTDILLFAPVFHEYPSSVPIHSPIEPHAKFMKFRLNLESGKVTESECLLEHFYERPSINWDYIGRPHHYAYLIDEGRGGIMGKGILKYDLLDEKELAYFDYEDAFGGEALFIPRASSKAEDDGYLVDLLMEESSAELLVLDAATMKEVCRIELPQRVPFGVHALWLNNDQIAGLQY